MSRQLNPIHLARGRRRQAVGAEFFVCPDGKFVTGGAWNCPAPATGGYTPSWPTTPPAPTGGYTPSWPTTPPTPTWGPTPPPVTVTPTIPTYVPEVPTVPTNVPLIPSVPINTPSYPQNPGNVPSNCRPICNPCPENQKRYYMPFVPQAGYTASVTAGSLVIFVGRPQKLFAPDRLIIGSTIGAYFDIVSLTIGNIPQSLSAGNVGAEMFSEVATYVMMTFDQAYPGIDIILTAQNKSSVTQTFQAQLVGEAVG